MPASDGVLRLLIPQWQGGNMPGYYLGGKVLAALVPETQGAVEHIAVPPPGAAESRVEEGIVARTALLEILRQAQAAIARHRPRAIVTLGGDCLVDLAPIAWLNARYANDLAVLWIDAHPDIMDKSMFPHAHAHVLALLMGEGDAKFVAAVPEPVRAENILYIGLTETTPFETAFIKSRGIAHFAPEDLAASIAPVIDWLRACGKKHIAVHFDLDVLDPGLYDFLYFRNPEAPKGAFAGIAKGRMYMEQIQAVLQAAAQEFDIVGLAVTEYLPWNTLKLAQDLAKLPLLRE
ncbi:MAG: arginase family protein [Candidatus Tokpelaia sp.]|nr:MAG: arginase family protein [Candidatus Tokpelaia sp.]KAA6207001.1 MAG: arginase family protein [Candidatus Tokpelaia sp.]